MKFSNHKPYYHFYNNCGPFSRDQKSVAEKQEKAETVFKKKALSKQKSGMKLLNPKQYYHFYKNCGPLSQDQKWMVKKSFIHNSSTGLNLSQDIK